MFSRFRLCTAFVVAAVLTAPLAVYSAPAAAPPDEVAALKKRVEEQDRLIRQILETNKDLEARLSKLEGQQGAAPESKGAAPATKADEEPEVPPLVLPGEETQATAQAPTPASGSGQRAAAWFTPDISVIGNHAARFFSVRGDADRNRLQLNELELALEQAVYPGIKFRAQLAADANEGFGVSAEEAYVNIDQLGVKGLGAMLGRKRMDFGKANPIHPHALPYADSPAAVTNFLGPDGMSGNGASVNYLLPMKGVFANLELGLFDHQPSDQGVDYAGRSVRFTRAASTASFYPVGLGVTGNTPLTRLWLSKELGPKSEIELGGSHVFGKADNGDPINLTGLDLTYKTFPGAFRKLQLQTELFWHHRDDREFGSGSHNRSGHYALLSYDTDQYNQWGLRYDNSRYPWPIDGRDQSMSLIWSHRLTEATLLRLQYKLGDRTSDVLLPDKRGYNELYLQFVWGAGSHTHPLN